MVKSMTGYGRAAQTIGGREITVEIRSVNNRYLDCTVKVPRTYIFAEDMVKSHVQKAVSRGKDPRFLADSVEKLRRMDEVNRKVLVEYVSNGKTTQP